MGFPLLHISQHRHTSDIFQGIVVFILLIWFLFFLINDNYGISGTEILSIPKNTQKQNTKTNPRKNQNHLLSLHPRSVTS